MNLRRLLPALLVASLCPFQTLAVDLTLEQIESIKKQAKAIKENLDTHLSSRYSIAGERFAAAANDPRDAVSLYLDCHKLVNFDREGRPESDFRAWKESQQDSLKEPENAESLQMQLRYLALSCKATEAESVEQVLAPLMSYIDSLSRLEEMPTAALTSSVASSIFSDAFYLNRLLDNNQGWEPVPFNIGGMYEKIIFPHLRAENPSALMGAWDKRIEQQSRIVQMINDRKEDALRGMDRDEQRRARSDQNRQGGIMKDLDMDDFTTRTLPKLQWARLKDMFHYASEVDAVQAMLPFLKEHLTHELGEDFFADFYQMIEEAGMGTDRLPGSASE